jgi:hypothetical protein
MRGIQLLYGSFAMASGNTDHDVTSERIHKELQRLRSESLLKDLLLAIVPLLVAGLSIYFSNENSSRQLAFAHDQLTQMREIENAKLLESFTEKILAGGKESDLARIALDSVRLTAVQKDQLSGFFEAEAGGSDSPTATPQAPTAAGEIDVTFAGMLSDLFAAERETRADAYTRTKNYLLVNDAGRLIDQMIAKVFSDPFNIKGRSNVLSILAGLPADKLADRRQILLDFLVEVEKRGAVNPAYAVGPQTRGWIEDIRTKLA